MASAKDLVPCGKPVQDSWGETFSTILPCFCGISLDDPKDVEPSVVIPIPSAVTLPAYDDGRTWARVVYAELGRGCRPPSDDAPRRRRDDRLRETKYRRFHDHSHPRELVKSGTVVSLDG